MTTPLATGFAHWNPLPARIALIAWLLLAALFVGITQSPLKSGNADGAPRGPCDAELYQAEVQRVAAGENYYDAAALELRARGYPTLSVFNWRTPLPMWLLGHLPNLEWGHAVLLLGVGCLLWLALLLAGTEKNLSQAGLSLLLLVGACLPCMLANFFVMPELWAGTLIALSVCSFGLGRTGWGVALGLLALACRDLAGPYCLVCLVIAIARGRRQEAAWWLAGLAAYAVFFGWHWQQVQLRLTDHEVAHAQGWVQFGAAGFVISTAQMNAFLLVLPQWITAIYLALALLGFAGWYSQRGLHAVWAACAYLALFAVVGQSFNQYWGCLIAPLLCLGAARAPAALRDLWRAAQRPAPDAQLTLTTG